MKKRLLLFAVLYLFAVGFLYCLPVVYIADVNDLVYLGWYNISRTNSVVLFTLLAGVFALSAAGRYRCGLCLNGIALLFSAFMVFSAWISVQEYNGKHIAFCHISLAVMLIFLLLNSFYLLNHCRVWSKSGRTSKEINSTGRKRRTISVRLQTAVVCVILVISLYPTAAAYNGIVSGQKAAAANEQAQEAVSSCAGLRILPENRDYENEVFETGESIHITYTMPEQPAALNYRLTAETTSGASASAVINDKDTNITKGFTVSFAVEADGEEEIRICLYSAEKAVSGMNTEASEETKTVNQVDDENVLLGSICIYTFTRNGHVFVDGASSQYGEERYYQWQLEHHEIDLETYNELIEGMYRITEDNAVIEEEVTYPMTRAAVSTVTVSGTIKWTDAAGKTHPANEIRVEIWDDDIVDDDLITAVYTDSNGKYTATFENDTSITENGYDIYVKVYARGRYTQVVDINGKLYSFEKDVCGNAVNGAAYTMNLTLGNQEASYRSIQIQQAVSMAAYYVRQREGHYLSTVYVQYPDGTQGTTCYTRSNNTIYVLPDDAYDWDVLQHEYGHHMSHELGCNASPGGDHSYWANMADTRESKSVGIKVAWSEGWATYFAISLQNKLNASSLEIPYVGDKNYTDTIDGNINYSLETCGYPLGEANEYAVSAVLFDIADGGTGESWDTVYMGYDNVYNLVVDNKCTDLSSFIKLIQGKSNRNDIAIGKILSKLGVSSKVKAPANGAKLTSSPPTFSWTAGGGSTKYPNNGFVIAFYDSSYKLLAQTSTLANRTQYTLPNAFWGVICDAAPSDKRVNWTIRASQTGAPGTGPYFSDCGYFFVP